MDQTSLNHWLGTSSDLSSDVIAIALQETWGSTSRVRSNSLIHPQTQSQASSPSHSQPTRTESVTTTGLIANTLADFEKVVEVSRGIFELGR